MTHIPFVNPFSPFLHQLCFVLLALILVEFRVWLTHSTLFFFVKIIDLPGKSMIPHQKDILFLPATPSSRSLTLEGLLELSRRPSRALHHSWWVTSDTSETYVHLSVVHTGHSDPRTLTDANLSCVLVKIHIVALKRIELSRWSDLADLFVFKEKTTSFVTNSMIGPFDSMDP